MLLRKRGKKEAFGNLGVIFATLAIGGIHSQIFVEVSRETKIFYGKGRLKTDFYLYAPKM